MKILYLIILILLSMVYPGQCEVIAPDNRIVEYYGNSQFKPSNITIDMFDTIIKIKLYNNFKTDENEYNVSDLKLLLTHNKTIAIIMSGKDKGNILLNPRWITSEIFLDIKEYCRYLDGRYIDVKAKEGQHIGKATIIEEKINKEQYCITIIIPRRILEGNNVMFEWSTAWCGNSLTKAEFYVPERKNPCCPVMPYTIDPSFKNNNPVVPWQSYLGSYFYPFGGFGWYDPIYYNPPYYNDNKIPQTPIPNSLILFVSSIILMRIFS